MGSVVKEIDKTLNQNNLSEKKNSFGDVLGTTYCGNRFLGRWRLPTRKNKRNWMKLLL